MLLSLAAISILPSERELSKQGLRQVMIDYILYSFLDSATNKARRRAMPTIPTTQLFEIPDVYSKTLRNNVFLIVDKMITRRQRLILFSSPEQLNLLFTSRTMLMDGTFSSCPKIFDQVYTIHCIKYEQCEWNYFFASILVRLTSLAFPCVFGLLPNRYKTTYQFLIHELKSIASDINLEFAPKVVMSDFESALVGVVKAEVSISILKFRFGRYLPIQNLSVRQSDTPILLLPLHTSCVQSHTAYRSNVVVQRG